MIEDVVKTESGFQVGNQGIKNIQVINEGKPVTATNGSAFEIDMDSDLRFNLEDTQYLVLKCIDKGVAIKWHYLDEEGRLFIETVGKVVDRILVRIYVCEHKVAKARFKKVDSFDVIKSNGNTKEISVEQFK